MSPACRPPVVRRTCLLGTRAARAGLAMDKLWYVLLGHSGPAKPQIIAMTRAFIVVRHEADPCHLLRRAQLHAGDSKVSRVRFRCPCF